MNPKTLLAVVGPTAAGKTDLALHLAQQFSGEIICADSRTIYTGMDIGTAKPTAEEQRQTPHYMLDVAMPNQLYSAAHFQRDAAAAIATVRERGNLPIVVGGTGLYAWALLYNYQFPAGASQARRAELEQLSLEELVQRLQQADPERAAEIDLQNPRRVVRALETVGQPRVAPRALPATTVLVGLDPGMEELERRIARRTKQMLAAGLVEETQGLIDQYGAVIEPLNTVPYREVIEYLNHEMSEAELPKHISLRTRQLAKRQLTWFKRNPDVQWVASPKEAQKLAATLLAKAV